VGKASEWLREERRRTLGEWVAFCVGCGHAQRYFEANEDALPRACPSCGGEVRRTCPRCDARFISAFAVECEACGAAVRPREQFGTAIRKTGR
jgi:predicted nucleic acid-binding Zn ribbon protein